MIRFSLTLKLAVLFVAVAAWAVGPRVRPRVHPRLESTLFNQAVWAGGASYFRPA